MAGESRYGFSEDDEAIEGALDELLSAVDSKDHKKLVDAIMAVVRVVRNQENKDEPDSL